MALRTSSEESSTIREVAASDRSPVASRYRRNRLTMFSTSMMASSTTTPTEMTSPARIIVLMVAPRR